MEWAKERHLVIFVLACPSDQLSAQEIYISITFRDRSSMARSENSDAWLTDSIEPENSNIIKELMKQER